MFSSPILQCLPAIRLANVTSVYRLPNRSLDDRGCFLGTCVVPKASFRFVYAGSATGSQ
jgi:hypothetical protein